jgi:predicted regulator of Ras-like GTPase activity (Roadblock/LC7/MglB family)
MSATFVSAHPPANHPPPSLPASLAPLPDALLRRARDEARQLLHDVDGARLVVVATVDGLDVAHAALGPLEASRTAAMASSMAALGQVTALEAGLGPPRCVIVEADLGHVIVRAVPRPDHPLVVHLMIDRSGLLGLALQQLSRCAQQLGQA